MVLGGLNHSNSSSVLHGSNNRNRHEPPRTRAMSSSASTAFESTRDDEMAQAAIQRSVARPKRDTVTMIN